MTSKHFEKMKRLQKSAKPLVRRGMFNLPVGEGDAEKILEVVLGNLLRFS